MKKSERECAGCGKIILRKNYDRHMQNVHGYETLTLSGGECKHRCKKCVVCDKCGIRYCIGYSVACKDAHALITEGHRPFVAYWDEHIAESNDPRGTYITSHYHRNKVMKQNQFDFKGKRVGEPGCMV